MNEASYIPSPEDNNELDPYAVIDYFESNKFNQTLWEEFDTLIDADSRNFFTPEAYRYLRTLDQGKRVLFLAFATKDLTTRPSDIQTYLIEFPEDREALAVAAATLGVLGFDDAFTHTFLTVLSGAFTVSADCDYVRQMPGIVERREVAPDFLLNGYEKQTTHNDLRKWFGNGANGYIAASEEAYDIDMGPNISFMENDQPFSNSEFDALPESQKSKLLRICLGTQQMNLVFHEAFNRQTTAQSVKEMNELTRASNAEIDGYGIDYDSHHSILFHSVQSNAAYELTDTSFNDRYLNPEYVWTGPVEAFPEEKIILAILKSFTERTPDPENVAVIVDFWNKNRDPMFTNAVAEALSIQGAEQAAAELMQLLQVDTTDNRNAIASVLYRLELGKIGMSEDGVRYLGRLYNLGEYNNRNFFVNRLTPNGDVGVFDQDKQLLGSFQISNVTELDTQIDAEVVAITYDTLFRDHDDVSPAERERREKFIGEFTQKYFEFFNEKMYERTGVRFNNLTFEEQGWFLSFVNEAGPNLQERVYGFVKRFGEEGIRVFLSMEFDRGIGDKVLEKISDTLHGREQLEKYNALLVGVRKFVASLGDQVSDQIKQAIELNLLRKAKDVLVSDLSEEESLAQFEKIRTDTLVFTSAFRELRKEGSLVDKDDLEILTLGSFESTNATDLSAVDKSRMVEIFDMYWAKKSFGGGVKKSFMESFEDPKTTFHILRHDGEIAGYARTDDRSDAEVPHTYFGSFNVDDSYEGAKIGDFIYRELIKFGLKQTGRVEADCEPDSKISKVYLRSFVATGTDMSYGEPLLHIVLDPEQYANMSGRSLSEAEIIALAESGSPDQEMIIREILEADEFIEFEAHRVMSRFFTDVKTGKTYGVFEYDQLK